MRAALGLGLVAVVAVGCHKEAAAPAPSTVDLDAMWKLAPEGAIFGMILSPSAMQMTEHAWLDVFAFIHTAPELASIAKQLDDQLQRFGTAKPTFATLGLSTTGAAAVFMARNGKVLSVIPLADRDKLIASVHGTRGANSDVLNDNTCKPFHDVYMCAEDLALFDLVGRGHLSAALADSRGDIELAGQNLPVGGVSISFGAVIQLARGAITLRGAVTGIPKMVLSALGEGSKPRVQSGRSSGFAIAHLKTAVGVVPLPDDAKSFMASIADPLSLVMYSNSIDAQLPLTDPSVTKRIIDACGDGPLGKLGARVANGTCELALPNAPGMSISLWLERATLHAGQKTAPAGTSVELTELGSEFATTEWNDAFYGRGSILGMTTTVASHPQESAHVNMALRGMLMVNELGIGVRTERDTLRFVLGARTPVGQTPTTSPRSSPHSISGHCVQAKAASSRRASTRGARRSRAMSTLAMPG